jgi:GNAT superfamily N-acetyltransferase
VSTPIRIINTRVEHTAACAELEQVCYPTLADEEKFRAEQFENHISLFPEGQWVAIDPESGYVIGATGGFRTTKEAVQTHNFFEMTSNGWFTRHDPSAPYYHGATMTVLPEYRGRGIARLFYAARKAMCQTLNLRGQIICCMLPSYAKLQIRNGFKVEGLLKDYFDDPPSRGWAALALWVNPNYTAAY